MSTTERVGTFLIAMGALIGLVAVLGNWWEPPPRVVAFVAFWALMMTASWRLRTGFLIRQKEANEV